MAEAGKALAACRDRMANEWLDWILSRAGSGTFEPEVLRRQLSLILGLMSEIAGPLRRATHDLWLEVTEWYGQTAAQRGLSTGEVVDEFGHLRELLIRDLSETIARFPARQSMATFLRLNRIVDLGVAHAVVGYTDALVESILNKRGIPVGGTESAEAGLLEQLTRFETDLAHIRAVGTDPPA